MSTVKRSSRNAGQALVELLVVTPVLLLLLLGAADMGKLFVISGKSEIAARYIALQHFRRAPFGDMYMGLTASQEVERIFFDDALDDSGLPEGATSESDDPDVTYTDIEDNEMLYAPVDQANPVLVFIWDQLDIFEPLVPIRGARATFTYDLPFFPYGRENPFEPSTLEDEPSPGRLAARYEAVGNFVMLTDSFSGEHAEEWRLAMEAAGFIVGANLSQPLLAGLVGVLWLIFLP